MATKERIKMDYSVNSFLHGTSRSNRDRVQNSVPAQIEPYPPRDSHGNASAARCLTPVATIPAIGVFVGSTIPFSLAYRLISCSTSVGDGPPLSPANKVLRHSSLLVSTRRDDSLSID